MPVDSEWGQTPVIAGGALGGLNTTTVPSQVPPNQLVVADNVTFGTRQTWKKRGGLVAQNSVVATGMDDIVKLIDYWESTGSHDRIAVSGTGVYKDDIDGTWDNASGTITVNEDPIVTHCIVGDELILAFDATIPYAYDTTTGNVTSCTPAVCPNGDLVAEHLGRLWINDKSNPHKINYTGVTSAGDGDPRAWALADGGGGFLIEPDDGDPEGITAIWKSPWDTLMVSKQKSIYEIQGRTLNTFTPVRVVEGIGCVSQNMVVTIGNDCFFPSLDGFHSLSLLRSGNMDPNAFLSRDIHETYHTKLNQSRIKYGHGAYIPDLRSIVWAVPGRGQSNNKIALVYNLTTRAWTKWTNFKCDSLMSYYNGTDNKVELWTGGDIGYVYKYDKAVLVDYNSSAIKMELKSGQIYPSQRFSDMWGWKWFNLLLSPKVNSSIDLSYRIDREKDSAGVLIRTTETIDQGADNAVDFLGDTFVLGTSVLGSDVFEEPMSIELSGEGRAIEWRIQNNTPGEDLEVVGYTIEIDDLSKQRGAA